MDNVPTKDNGMIVTEYFVLNSRDAINRHRTLFFAVGSVDELMCCSACTTEGVYYTTNCSEDTQYGGPHRSTYKKIKSHGEIITSAY